MPTASSILYLAASSLFRRLQQGPFLAVETWGLRWRKVVKVDGTCPMKLDVLMFSLKNPWRIATSTFTLTLVYNSHTPLKINMSLLQREHFTRQFHGTPSINFQGASVDGFSKPVDDRYILCNPIVYKVL